MFNNIGGIVMSKSVTTLRRVSREDAKILALYLYRLSAELVSSKSYSECQMLLDSLIAKLNLKDHADRVLKAFIKRLIAQGKLTPKKTCPDDTHPFDTREKLEMEFHEDYDIYSSCGLFMTTDEFKVNMCRCIFTRNQNLYQKILGCIFFHEDKENISGKEFIIPKAVKVPREILDSARNLSKVKFIKDTLKLTAEEANMLNCCYRVNSVNEFHNALSSLLCSLDRETMLAAMINKSVKEISALVKHGEKLHSFGFISDYYELSMDAIVCIENQSMNSYFNEVIKKNSLKSTYPLESFSIKKDKTELIKKILSGNSAANILLYGFPGSGKTEFAKAIAKATGMETLVYNNKLESEISAEAALYKINCLLSVNHENSIIIVDEAEGILKTISIGFGIKTTLPSKGTVNKMLETSSNKVIWILNYTNELDESTLRRFTYSIHFDEMPKKMIRSITESKLKKIRLQKNLKENILDLCTKYHLTGSSVDNIIKTIRGMDLTKENEETILSDINNVLESNSTLLYGKSKFQEHVRDSYDLSVLNSSIPADSIVKMIENSVSYREDHKYNSFASDNGIRILLYGASGTGKTELARYISTKLNKQIILKRASDIMSSYVGENEANIRNAFAEAEANDAILLFDEADSFFCDRSNAKNSWERTMVNEFLTQMEEFSGILICTTNLRNLMDPALQRRFHIMSEFKPLNEDGIIKMMNNFFGDIAFSNEEIERITRYSSVTPGDFGSLAGKIRFMSKAEINSSIIVDELCAIQEEKKGEKTIGFRI